MRILLADTTQYFPSSPMFLEALQELALERSYEWRFLDEAAHLGSTGASLPKALTTRLYDSCCASQTYSRALVALTRRFKPDLVVVVKGTLLTPRALRAVKDTPGVFLACFSSDDPFNDQASSRRIREAISCYDLYLTPRWANMRELRAADALRVEYMPFGYKPSVHYPESAGNTVEAEMFSSDVVFVGGCDPDRVPFFEAIARELPDVRMSLYGGYWDRQPLLGRYHRGFVQGRAYRLAISGGAICVNLVRRKNRDGHVMRTFEVPAIGGFMLAERTEDHEELFAPGKEVALFSGTDGLVESVHHYLSAADERREMASRGHVVATQGGHTYKDRLARIIELAS